MWVGRVCHSVRSLYRGMGKLSTPARALLQGAAVLILDESFAALISRPSTASNHVSWRTPRPCW